MNNYLLSIARQYISYTPDNQDHTDINNKRPRETDILPDNKRSKLNQPKRELNIPEYPKPKFRRIN